MENLKDIIKIYKNIQYGSGKDDYDKTKQNVRELITSKLKESSKKQGNIYVYIGYINNITTHANNIIRELSEENEFKNITLELQTGNDKYDYFILICKKRSSGCKKS